MAIIIPNIDELNLLPQPLTNGEAALMKTLMAALDNTWTIYVQPHLNGLKPDLVVYKESCGMGIFEVKDWNLDFYKIEDIDKWYEWKLFLPNENRWGPMEYECPFEQVKRYRDTIFNYEIPILSAHCSIDRRVYQYVNMFVFFNGQKTEIVEEKLATAFQYQKYVNGFGDDYLDPNQLKRYLNSHHLTRNFPDELLSGLRNEEIDRKIQDALAYHRTPIDKKSLLVNFTPKQTDLLSNNTKPRRVTASAGSGKTLLIVHKAVNAAREGKTALVICFNITMANYLRDMIVSLANHYQLNAHQFIYVRHYHRIFPIDSVPREKDLPRQTNVLLIDEGQDFEREWIIRLLEKFQPDHWMIAEDLRQNIYEKDYHQRKSVPGISGRPNRLNESFRLPAEISQLANELIHWMKIQEDPDESDDVEPIGAQLSLLVPNWADGSLGHAVASIEQTLIEIIHEDKQPLLEDMAILVCEIEEDGWPVLEMLERHKLPYQSNFESQGIHKALMYNCEADGRSPEIALEKCRRGLKANFYTRSGRIKVCTIHSFKGWELNDVIIIFRPRKKDKNHQSSLLYTAITRSMNKLTIYNAEPEFIGFGELAAEMGLVNTINLSPDGMKGN